MLPAADEIIEDDVNEFYEISSTVIGKGAFGTVVEGTKKDGSNEKVAIKIIKLVNHIQSQIAHIRTEVASLKCLNHPNIVKLHNFYETSTAFHLCMEIVKGGELFDRITQKSFYSEKDARDLVSILISALKHCHDNNIVHRDVKAENLLMVSDEDDADVKLVDFGFAVRADGNSLEGVIGTPEYMAPEIWVNKVKYGAPVDMWALGVLSYIILAGYPPFYDNAPLRLKTKIMRGIYEFHPEYWSKVSEEAKDFVTRLLTVDMNTRMTAEQALLHPWLHVHEDELASRKLEDSILQMKRFNARRRLKASCNAIIAVGKMSRMMSLFRSKSGSSSVAASRMEEESNLDGIKLDDLTTPDTPTSPGCRMTSNQVKENVESVIFPTQDDVKCSVSSTESSYTGHEIQDRNCDNDEELFGAVHKRIEELEKENENILLSLINVEITPNQVENMKEIDGKSAGISSDLPSGSNTKSEEVVKVDSVDDLKRLLFEANTATIKSLHINLLL